MKVTVKRGGQKINEIIFDEQTVHIGRHAECEICLPDKTVSRKHACVIPVGNGQWAVKDLGSANKTYLSGKQIEKAELNHNDVLLIGDFTLEFDLTTGIDDTTSTELEDTLQVEASLTTPSSETVVRKPDSAHAPAMRLAARRLTDFSEATESICKAENIDQLLVTLLHTIIKQFTAFRVWCALREQPSGPMIYHVGKRRDGKAVDYNQLQLKDSIKQAIEKSQSIVFPRVAPDIEETERIRSAMIAPVVRRKGCFGLFYVDNAMARDHYTLGDLDYLMLLAMHTAAILKNYF